MAQKLKLVLTAPILWLLCKSFLFAVTLLGIRFLGGWWSLVFIPMAFVLYFFPVFHTARVLASFFILLTLSVFYIFSVGYPWFFLVAFVAAVIFFFILGIKTLWIINPSYYLIIRYALVYFLIAFFVVGAATPVQWLPRILVIVFGLHVLAREFLLQVEPAINRQLAFFAPALYGLFAAELLWLGNLLSFSSINIVNGVFLFLYFLDNIVAMISRRDFAYRHAIQYAILFLFVTSAVMALFHLLTMR